MVRRELQRMWADAFARQARSDKQTYEVLCKQPGLPECHRLHYLQMFLEKLCKVHLWRDWGPIQGRPEFLTSHGVIAKALPLAVSKLLAKDKGRPIRSDEMFEIRRICREIELLAPAIDDDRRRPDNCEYPWAGMDQGQSVVLAPCEWRFPLGKRLNSPLGTLLIKAAFLLSQQAEQP
jgi:hypothetical protein